MPLVEALRVQTVQTMHGERELLARALDDQMEVSSEEAPGDRLHFEELRCLLEQEGEGCPIEVINEYDDASGASARDVKDAVRKIAARSARHG
jgi:hypothetical protein